MTPSPPKGLTSEYHPFVVGHQHVPLADTHLKQYLKIFTFIP